MTQTSYFYGVMPRCAYHFTGKERDSETGLDYFGARYYASNMGRWMSPDWSAAADPIPYADLSDPPTLNLYGYVRSNPLSHADADGHCDENGICGTLVGAAQGTWNFVKNTAVGTVQLAGAVGQDFGSPVPINTGTMLVTPVVNAAQDYNTMGVSGVANAVLDQGGQGAMAIVTEAVLTGGLAASAKVNSITPESWAVPDANVVVRGGSGPMPPAGETFSGAHGTTVEGAAQGVPHGQIRTSTAGEIRQAGGSVRSKPELTRSGTMNQKHVNVREGTNKPSTFSQPKPNPVPKKDRIS